MAGHRADRTDRLTYIIFMTHTIIIHHIILTSIFCTGISGDIFNTPSSFLANVKTLFVWFSSFRNVFSFTFQAGETSIMKWFISDIFVEKVNWPYRTSSERWALNTHITHSETLRKKESSIFEFYWPEKFAVAVYTVHTLQSLIAKLIRQVDYNHFNWPRKLNTFCNTAVSMAADTISSKARWSVAFDFICIFGVIFVVMSIEQVNTHSCWLFAFITTHHALVRALIYILTRFR